MSINTATEIPESIINAVEEAVYTGDHETPPESIVRAAVQAAYEEGRLMIVGRTTCSPTGWRYADAEDPGAEAEMASLGPVYEVDSTGLIK